ncbi:uncharacterized protein [Spinacia oleracea]|uniref:DNA helicase Pif1-like 2B domain-containing protein n=1 Tax=Spinacia oleracea TaxID=3562 RepID=A0A9R0I0X3_SPIOL|nr:uncharacterized protein LOC110780355 [Spinacia oleracea]
MLNEKILKRFAGRERIYYSFDSVPEDRQNLYQQEFLNSLSFGGFPPHALRLKVGSPIMLLRNIDTSSGLCNGTRLVCCQLMDHVIEAEILTGHNKGTRVFIPRIPLKTAEDVKLPFSHGQLYVALSRGISQQTTKILVSKGDIRGRDGVFTKNVVYKEVLLP